MIIVLSIVITILFIVALIREFKLRKQINERIYKSKWPFNILVLLYANVVMLGLLNIKYVRMYGYDKTAISTYFLIVILFLSITQLAFQRKSIYEGGIRTSNRLITWQDVHGYEWQEKNNKLYVTMYYDLVLRENVKCRYLIPFDKKEEIEAVLIKYENSC